MFDILQYDFMINALIASVLASVACGIVGTYIFVKRIVFISGGIAHIAYGGIGLGYLIGINPIIGAFIFTLIAAIIIARLRRYNFQNEDTIIGILWAFGMALGIIFINLTPGYVPDLMSYLFGSILTIPGSEIFIMIILDLVILSIVTFLFKEMQAITFDEEFSRVIGLPVDNLYLLLLIMIALTIVLLIRLVGIILVIALLSIPPAISINYVKSIKGMMILSVFLGLFFSVTGLIISYYTNMTSGATIIITAVIGYLLSLLYVKLSKTKVKFV